jgi:hypothetical protein
MPFITASGNIISYDDTMIILVFNTLAFSWTSNSCRLPLITVNLTEVIWWPLACGAAHTIIGDSQF